MSREAQAEADSGGSGGGEVARRRQKRLPRELEGRVEELLDLRVTGLSVGQIAKRTGLRPGVVEGMLERGFSRVLGQVEEERGLELARLDALMRTYLPKAQAGDREAAKLVLQIGQQRAKLTGTEAPSRVQVAAQVAHEHRAVQAAVAFERLTPDLVDAALSAYTAQSTNPLALPTHSPTTPPGDQVVDAEVVGE